MKFLIFILLLTGCGADEATNDIDTETKELKEEKVIVDKKEPETKKVVETPTVEEEEVVQIEETEEEPVEATVLQAYTFEDYTSSVAQVDYLLCSGMPAAQWCRLLDITISEWSDGSWTIDMVVKFGAATEERVSIESPLGEDVRHTYGTFTQPHHMFTPEVIGSGTTYFDFDFVNKKMVGKFVHAIGDDTEYEFKQYDFIEVEL